MVMGLHQSIASCVDGAQGLGMESTTVEPGAFRGWRIPVVGCQRAVGKPINLFYIIWGFPPKWIKMEGL